MTDGKRVSYEEYLKKYCGCEGPICTVKPKVSGISTESEAKKPKLLHGGEKFISADQVDVNPFKKRLLKLTGKLKHCDDAFYFEKE